MMRQPKVLIIAASDSSLPVMIEAAKVLEEFGITYEITIASAHRSPAQTVELIENAGRKGVKVIIAGAGLAAHLAGVVAAHFPLPVIGVPLKDGALHGFDSLHATVQMPPGIPVATVAVDGARNAGILAVQILATSDDRLEGKLVAHKKKLAEDVREKATKLAKLGWREYVAEKKK